MLTKVLAPVLVVLIGLALGIETARYVHVHATGVDVSGAVNIHHALGFSLLATSGALLLSLSREWLSRQWTRFTVWLELTLDGLFDFDELDVVLRGDDAKRLLVSLKNHASPGEFSGNSEDALLAALQKTKGSAELLLTWEGGDSFTGLRVVDGKVTKHDIRFSLGDECK